MANKKPTTTGVTDSITAMTKAKIGLAILQNGDPLELASAPVSIFIDGVSQPMTTRQTKLRDRYLDPAERALPKAYER